MGFLQGIEGKAIGQFGQIDNELGFYVAHLQYVKRGNRKAGETPRPLMESKVDSITYNPIN